jgi:hypothetical protein
MDSWALAFWFAGVIFIITQIVFGFIVGLIARHYTKVITQTIFVSYFVFLIPAFYFQIMRAFFLNHNCRGDLLCTYNRVIEEGFSLPQLVFSLILYSIGLFFAIGIVKLKNTEK